MNEQIVAKSLEILSNIVVKRCKSRHKNYTVTGKAIESLLGREEIHTHL
jgi:hypothetical protein